MESSGVGTMRCTSRQGQEIYIFVTDVQVVVESWQEALGVQLYRDTTMVSLESHGIAMEVKVDSAVIQDV